MGIFVEKKEQIHELPVLFNLIALTLPFFLYLEIMIETQEVRVFVIYQRYQVSQQSLMAYLDYSSMIP
jgi:hypothetical protein